MDSEENSGSHIGHNKNLAIAFGVTALILFAIVGVLIAFGATLQENALIAIGGIISLGFGAYYLRKAHLHEGQLMQGR